MRKTQSGACLVLVGVPRRSPERYVTSGGNVSVLKLLQIFRLVRILRIIRVMRFFKELRLMVQGLLRSALVGSWVPQPSCMFQASVS